MNTFMIRRLFNIVVFIKATFFFNFFLHADENPIVYVTLDADPTTCMNVSWITDKKDVNDTIYYQASSQDQPWQQARGTHTLFATKKHNVHHVRLVELLPDTIYRIQLNNKPVFYSFKTVPAEPPISFVIGGDTKQRGIDRFKYTNRTAAATRPDFVVLAGDLAYACRGKNKPEALYDWLSWLKVYQETMQNDDLLIPFAVTIGNHDVNGGGFDKSPSDARAFYTLFPFLTEEQGYNKICIQKWLSIYLLDSGHTNEIGGAQAAWLKQELANDQDTRNRFAAYHMPAYPLKLKNLSKQSKQMRKKWVPLFEQYRLHIAFEHHEHGYKRTFPLFNGIYDKQGVIYMGGGGWSVEPRKVPEMPDYLACKEIKEHFIFVKLEKNHRTLIAKSPSGSFIDFVNMSYRILD